MISILMFPVPIMVLIAWGLIEYDIIKADVFTYSQDFKDIYNASSYDSWYDNAPTRIPIWVFGGLSMVYLICGILELLSFYATSFRDTGKYLVRYTRCKRI